MRVVLYFMFHKLINAEHDLCMESQVAIRLEVTHLFCLFFYLFFSFFHLCVFVYLQNTTIGCFPYSILTYVVEIPVLTTLLTAELENIDLFHL